MLEFLHFSKRYAPVHAPHAGVRRFLIGGFAAVLAAFAALELFVYHLAVDPSGTILVRPGLKQSFSLYPLHFYSPVDTGIELRQVDQSDDAAVKSLADGGLWGFRTHVDEDGLRTWLGSLENKRFPRLG